MLNTLIYDLDDGRFDMTNLDDLDILSRYPVSRRLLSVADYHRMAEAGILGEDDRVELLEGQLIAMAPVGPRHALAVDALTDLLSHALSPPARLRVQNPVTLNGRTEPQPDIAVVRLPWRGYPGAHPGPAPHAAPIFEAGDVVKIAVGAPDARFGFEVGRRFHAEHDSSPVRCAQASCARSRGSFRLRFGTSKSSGAGTIAVSSP